MLVARHAAKHVRRQIRGEFMLVMRLPAMSAAMIVRRTPTSADLPAVDARSDQQTIHLNAGPEQASNLCYLQLAVLQLLLSDVSRQPLIHILMHSCTYKSCHAELLCRLIYTL